MQKNLTLNMVKIDLHYKKIKKTQVSVELNSGISCIAQLKNLDECFTVFLNKILFVTENGVYFREILKILIKGKIIKYLKIF